MSMSNKDLIQKMIRERLETGAGYYGDDFARDACWEQETLEELLDACVYLSVCLLKKKQMGINLQVTDYDDQVVIANENVEIHLTKKEAKNLGETLLKKVGKL